MPADLEPAVDALRRGQVARAQVLTRRAARPAWIDALPAEDIDNLRNTSLGALFWAADAEKQSYARTLLGEWLIPLVRDAIRSVDVERRVIDVDMGFVDGR